MATKEQGYTDITATGARTGRELQQENGSTFQQELDNNGGDFENLLQSFRETQNQLSSNINNKQISSVNEESFSLSPKEVVSSLNGDWGDSMWDDEHATESDFQNNLSDIRADNQWGTAQLAAGAGKMATTGISTFLNSTIGLVFGLGQGIVNAASDDPNKTFIQGLWDNDFNHAMTEFQDEMEKVMPNYYSSEELQSPWYSNILSANFWGDKVLKNTGFTIGAGAAMWLTGGVGGLTELGTLGLGRAAAGLARTFGAGLGTMKNVMTGFSKAGSLAKAIVNAGISANGEAAMEAVNASKEVTETAMENLQQKKREALMQLDLYDPDYDTKRQQILEASAAYEEDIKARARDVGNGVWGANMVILGISNSIEFGHILKGGYKQSTKLVKPHFTLDGKDVSFKDAVTGMLRGEKAEAVNDVNKGFGRKLLHTVKNAASEGMEEGSQNMASNTEQTANLARLNQDAARYKYDDGETIFGKKINPEVTEDLVSLIKSCEHTMAEQFGGFEKGGWEEFFLGALTGGAGFMNIQRKQVKDENGNLVYGKDGKPQTKWGVVWEGGYAEASRTIDNEFEDNQRLVDAINKRFSSPEFQKRMQHAVAQLDFDKEMEQALLQGDQFNFKNSELGALVEDYFFFKDMGMLDNFKDKWENFSHIDDKTLQQLYIATLKDGNAEQLTTDQLENLRTQYEQKAKSNLDKFKLIEDAYEYVDARFPEYSPDFKYEMTYQYIKMADAKNRIHSITNQYAENPDLQGKTLSQKINYYLNTSVEKLAIQDDIWARMSEQDRFDIEKLKRRVKAASDTIKRYEKDPEQLAWKLYLVQQAANAKKEGMDYDSIVQKIQNSNSPAEVNDIWGTVAEENRHEFFTRILETADDDVRKKLVMHANLMTSYNSMYDDYTNSTLDEERQTKYAQFLNNVFTFQNESSDQLIDAFEGELDALKRYDVDNSTLIKSMNLDRSTTDGSSAWYEAIWLLTDGIEYLKDAVANFGEYSKMLQKNSERVSAEKAAQIRGEGGQQRQKLTRDYLKTTRCFKDLAAIADENEFNNKVKEVATIATDIYNTGSNLTFDDIDDYVYSIQNGYLTAINQPDNFQQSRLLHMDYIRMYYSGSKKFQDTEDKDYWYAKMVKDVIENQKDKVFEKEDFVNGELILAASPAETSEEPPSPLDNLTDEERTVYNDIVASLGREPSLGEQAQIATAIKDVENCLNRGALVPERYSYIADIIESHKKSLTPDSASAYTPEIPISEGEMLAMYNKGFDIDALADRHHLKYNTDGAEVEHVYGNFDHWKSTQFVIDNYLQELKDEPIHFIYNTKSDVPKDKGGNTPYYKTIFTAVKYSPSIIDKLVKDNNQDKVWVVSTQDGQYLIIGSMGFPREEKAAKTARYNYYKDIEADLKPKEGEDPYNEEWHVGTKTTKILNIGDGRMVDTIDQESSSTTNLKDILEDTTRNPKHLRLEDLRFSIFYPDGHRYPKELGRPVHSNTIQDENEDSGKVYLYIPTASDTYYRHPLKTVTLRDIMQDENKRNSEFMSTLKDYIGDALDSGDWENILRLQNMLYIEHSVYFDFKDTNNLKLEVKPRGGERKVIPLTGTKEEMIDQILTTISDEVNPRVQITTNMLNENGMKHMHMLLDSGLLETQSATMIGTTAANYTIALPGSQSIKPAPHLATRPVNEKAIYYVNGKQIVVQGTSITKYGKALTSAERDLFNLILDCEAGTYTGYNLTRTKQKKVVELKGLYYFIEGNKGHYTIIHRDNSGNWEEITKNKKDLVDLYIQKKNDLQRSTNTLEGANAVRVPTVDDPSIAGAGPNLDGLSEEERKKAEEAAAATSRTVLGRTTSPKRNEAPQSPSEAELQAIEDSSYNHFKSTYATEDLGSLSDLRDAFMGEINDPTLDVKKRSACKGGLRAIEELIDNLQQGNSSKYPIGTVVYIKFKEGDFVPLKVSKAEGKTYTLTNEGNTKSFEIDEDTIDTHAVWYQEFLKSSQPAEGYEVLTNTEIGWFEEQLDAERKRREDEHEAPMSQEDAFDIVDFKRVEYSQQFFGKEASVGDIQKVADNWYKKTYPVKDAPKSLDALSPEELKKAETPGSNRSVLGRTRSTPKTTPSAPPVQETVEEQPQKQTKDMPEYWRNPDNFENPIDKSIAAHFDQVKDIVTKRAFCSITEQAAINRIALALGVKPSNELLVRAKVIDSESTEKAHLPGNIPTYINQYKRLTGGHWFVAGSRITVGILDTRTGEVVGPKKEVTVQEVMDDGSLVTEDGTYHTQQVLYYFGANTIPFEGNMRAILEDLVFGPYKTAETIADYFKCPSDSWENIQSYYAKLVNIADDNCYTGPTFTNTLELLQAAQNYGFISPSIRIKEYNNGQLYIPIQDWEKAVQDLKLLGFDSPKSVALIPKNNVQQELQARRGYSDSEQQVTIQETIDRVNNLVSNGQNRQQLIEQLAKQNISLTQRESSKQVFELAGYLQKEVIGTMSISMNDWQVFIGSQEGLDFLVSFFQDYSTQFVTQEQQNLENPKKKTNEEETKRVSTLNNSENFASFVELLDNMPSQRQEALIESLKPNFEKLGLDTEDLCIPDDFYDALRDRGITEEQYLNVKSIADLDSLIDRINNCR